MSLPIAQVQWHSRFGKNKKLTDSTADSRRLQDCSPTGRVQRPLAMTSHTAREYDSDPAGDGADTAPRGGTAASPARDHRYGSVGGGRGCISERATLLEPGRAPSTNAPRPRPWMFQRGRSSVVATTSNERSGGKSKLSSRWFTLPMPLLHAPAARCPPRGP